MKILTEKLYWQVDNQIWDKIWDQVRRQVGRQVWDQVGRQVLGQVGSQGCWQANDQVRRWQIGNQVYEISNGKTLLARRGTSHASNQGSSQD